MKTKLPVITVEDWLQAEAQLLKLPPQPEGSVTVKQYAEMTGRSPSRAQESLRALVDSGRARREKWEQAFVYWLVKK